MAKPIVRFMPTDSFQNNWDWKNELSAIYDTVEQTFESEMNGWEQSTLYGSVIDESEVVDGDVSVNLDANDRENIQNGRLSTLNNHVQTRIGDNDEKFHTVVVFDDHNYDGFAGVAQIGEPHYYKQIRVAICGTGGGSTRRWPSTRCFIPSTRSTRIRRAPGTAR